MEIKRQTKRARLSQHLAETRPDRIGEPEWRRLRAMLAPVSDSYLRRLLLACGVPLDPVVEGVRQDSLAELERTLLALAEAYALALEAGDRERAVQCRQAVLTGKEHARLAARRAGASPAAVAEKEEMASWMLVWLETPAVFPTWLALRKKAMVDAT